MLGRAANPASDRLRRGGVRLGRVEIKECERSRIHGFDAGSTTRRSAWVAGSQAACVLQRAVKRLDAIRTRILDHKPAHASRKARIACHHLGFPTPISLRRSRQGCAPNSDEIPLADIKQAADPPISRAARCAHMRETAFYDLGSASLQLLTLLATCASAILVDSLLPSLWRSQPRNASPRCRPPPLASPAP